MKFAPPPHTKKARIEIIPLIDVIFFLLATFVLVSLSMTRLQGIDMELPMGSAQKDPTQTPETVTVSIMASGNCVWDKRLMTQDQLMTRMAQYRRESPTRASSSTVRKARASDWRSRSSTRRARWASIRSPSRPNFNPW
jgi:biopolymer transport protein ExbD